MRMESILDTPLQPLAYGFALSSSADGYALISGLGPLKSETAPLRLFDIAIHIGNLWIEQPVCLCANLV